MRFDAIIFDFDGVIIDSELPSNRILAEHLTAAGLPTTLEDSLRDYMGHHWDAIVARIESRLPGLPTVAFRDRWYAESERRAGEEAIAPIAGVIDFIRALPDKPRAVASAAPVRWLASNLDRIGIGDAFRGHLYSGSDHVARSKPFPDVYLHAARAIAVDPSRAIAIEDTPMGVAAAHAAGMTVIGLCAGGHCGVGHGDRLIAAGAHHVARDYDEVRRLVS